MSDVTIAELPDAGVVSGTDLIPVFRDGQTYAATASAVQSSTLTPSYVVLGSDGSLLNERVLTAGTGIAVTDGGAGGNVTVGVTNNATLPGSAGITIPRGTTAERPVAGIDGTYLRWNTDAGAYEFYAGGTWNTVSSSSTSFVTSVGLSLPAEFSVSGSPVTAAGTLSGAWASATQNYVFAAPSGSSGTPSFRALVAGDIPSLPYLSATLASTNILVGNGSNVATAVALSGDATLANTGAVTVSSFDGGTDFKSMAGQAADSVAITGGTATFSSLHAGDVGTEGSGININGVTFQSTFKVSDIDGTNFAQTILHRHSTTLEPLILGARSNIDTTGHASVTNGQNVFSIYGSGSAGSNYKLFGAISVGADATGTISNTSAPGRWTISVTPDGSVNPVTAVTIANSGAVACASATFTLNGAQVLTGNQNITLSGDVSGTGTTGITTAIGANKVTTGMLAQAAGSTLLGNSSTSTANVAALTDAQAATVLARYLELAPRWYS